MFTWLALHANQSVESICYGRYIEDPVSSVSADDFSGSEPFVYKALQLDYIRKHPSPEEQYECLVTWAQLSKLLMKALNGYANLKRTASTSYLREKARPAKALHPTIASSAGLKEDKIIYSVGMFLRFPLSNSTITASPHGKTFI